MRRRVDAAWAKRRLDVESRYWRLVLSGVGTVEACRTVGIGRKTGYRWRAENGGGLPPARLAKAARDEPVPDAAERHQIATLRGQGLGTGDRPPVGSLTLDAGRTEIRHVGATTLTPRLR